MSGEEETGVKGAEVELTDVTAGDKSDVIESDHELLRNSETDDDEYDNDDDEEIDGADPSNEGSKNCCSCGSGKVDKNKVAGNYGITKGDAKREGDIVLKHPKTGKYFGTVDSIGGRTCTDVLILLALVICWAAMSAIGYEAYQNGDPYRLLGPIDSLGRVCGYDESVSHLPKFYTVSEYGLGTCVAECFNYDAPLTSTQPSDYVCLSIPGGIPTTNAALSSYIANYCMDTSVTPNVYDSSTNCGCNLIRETTEFFRRCRFTDPNVASNYVTQGRPSFLDGFVSDVLRARQPIFGFGFAVAVVLSFVVIRLFHYESIGSFLIWSFIVGVVFLMSAMLYLAQKTVGEWQDEVPRTHSMESILALKSFSAVLAGIAFLYSCMIIFLRKRINTAIKAISLAARAVDAMPIIVSTPVFQVAGFALFMLPMIVYCFYLATDGYFENVYKEMPYSGIKVLVGKQYHLNEGVVEKLWFLFFCLLWTMNFLVALGSLVIALAVSKWYFTMPNKRWRNISGWTVFGSYYKALRYHAGTAAFGALLVSLIQYAKAVASYIQRQLPKKTKERMVVKFIFCLVKCFLECLERCMKFISKHAYIQTAIHSTNFMMSAKNAFFTIARNIFLIGIVAAISDMGILVGKVFVCLLSTASFYYYIDHYYAGVLFDLVAPTLLVLMISWITVTMFMDVFSIAIDTIIMCYLTDLEQNDGRVAAFVDKNTKLFVITHNTHDDLTRAVDVNAQSSYRRSSLDRKSGKEIREHIEKIAKSVKVGETIDLTNNLDGHNDDEHENANQVLANNIYAPDAGRYHKDPKKRSKPHLSIQKALDYTYLNRPMEFNQVNKRWQDYPLSQYFGRFRGPIEYLCRGEGDEHEKSSILQKYGIGVAFYFRLLKSLGIIFSFMSLITLPTLVIFSMSANVPHEDTLYTATTRSEQMLAFSTIASFSEPIPTCRDTNDGDLFGFSCPEPYKISSIVAYFGQNNGYCGCPWYNQPAENGDCKSSIIDSTYPGSCGLDPTTGNPAGCFQTKTRYDNNCCASSVDKSGKPDNSFLNLGLNGTCNSYTAPFILQSLCEGESSCFLNVNSTRSYLIELSSLPSSAPADMCRSTPLMAGTQYCETSLDYKANFQGCDLNVYKKLIFEAVCVNTEVIVGKEIFDPRDLIIWASYLDAAAILVYIISVYWIKFTIQREEADANKATCTASDYTVVCKTIPLHSDEDDADEIKRKIKDFFEKKIAWACEQKQFVPHEPIEIADINFSTTYTSYLDNAVKRGAASYEIDILINKISSQLQRKVFDETRPAGMQLMKDLTRSILRFEIANDECSRLSPVAQRSVHYAYITFANETSFIECLKAFPNIGVLTRFVQAKELRMDDRLVKLRRSEDPAEIIWENLALSKTERFLRVLVVTIASIIILGVSYAIIYQVKYSSNKFLPSQTIQACSTFNIIVSKDPVVYHNSSTNDITYEKVIWDENPDYFHQLYPSMNSSTYGSLGYATCYCQRLLYEFDGDLLKMKEYEFEDPMKGSQYYCDSGFSDDVIGSIASYIATLIIIVINISMQYFLRFSVKFERHADKTAEAVSLSLKLFILQFINTGILALIISGDLSRVDVENLSFGTAGVIHFGIFTGNINDFNKRWYFSVGSSILFTMFCYVFSSMPYTVYKIIMAKFKRLWDSRWDFSPKSTHLDLQHELNALYLGPDADFELKYASLLSLIFVDLLYSAAMPLLYPITVMNIALIYLIEKYLFLRVTKSPPILNADIPKKVVYSLLVAAVFHSAMGLWMFSNTAFYAPEIIETSEWTTDTTPSFYLSSHDWDPPVIWKERLMGTNSWHLFIIVCVCGSMIGLQIVESILFEYLGLRPMFNNFFYLLKKKFECLRDVNLPIVEFEYEGNHPYFDSIKLEVLKIRVASGLLSEEVQKRYQDRIVVLNAQLMEEMNREVEDANRFDSDDNDYENRARESEKEAKEIADAKEKELNDQYKDAYQNILTEDTEVLTPTSDNSDDVYPANKLNKKNSASDSNSMRDSEGSSVARDRRKSSIDFQRASITRSMKKQLSEFSLAQKLREMVGHESYNVATLPEYIVKFGLESVHFRRVRPDDWVVMHAMLGNPPDDSEELKKILEDCAPIRNEKGEISWYDRHFMV